jgi:hypothetical protein
MLTRTAPGRHRISVIVASNGGARDPGLPGSGDWSGSHMAARGVA